MELLPDEMILHVFSFLDAKCLSLAALTCWRWRKVAADRILWQNIKLTWDYEKARFLKYVLQFAPCLGTLSLGYIWDQNQNRIKELLDFDCKILSLHSVHCNPSSLCLVVRHAFHLRELEISNVTCAALIIVERMRCLKSLIINNFSKEVKRSSMQVRQLCCHLEHLSVRSCYDKFSEITVISLLRACKYTATHLDLDISLNLVSKGLLDAALDMPFLRRFGLGFESSSYFRKHSFAWSKDRDRQHLLVPCMPQLRHFVMRGSLTLEIKEVTGFRVAWLAVDLEHPSKVAEIGSRFAQLFDLIRGVDHLFVRSAMPSMFLDIETLPQLQSLCVGTRWSQLPNLDPQLQDKGAKQSWGAVGLRLLRLDNSAGAGAGAGADDKVHVRLLRRSAATLRELHLRHGTKSALELVAAMPALHTLAIHSHRFSRDGCYTFPTERQGQELRHVELLEKNLCCTRTASSLLALHADSLQYLRLAHMPRSTLEVLGSMPRLDTLRVDSSWDEHGGSAVGGYHASHWLKCLRCTVRKLIVLCSLKPVLPFIRGNLATLQYVEVSLRQYLVFRRELSNMFSTKDWTNQKHMSSSVIFQRRTNR